MEEAIREGIKGSLDQNVFISKATPVRSFKNELWCVSPSPSVAGAKLYPGHCVDFSKGAHTVTNRGYSPDFYVDLHAVFTQCDQKKKPSREGGSQAPQDSTGYALVYVIRKRVIKSAVLRKFD